MNTLSETEMTLAAKILLEIGLELIQGESNIRDRALAKYGEYGFDLVENYCKGCLADKRLNAYKTTKD